MDQYLIIQLLNEKNEICHLWCVERRVIKWMDVWLNECMNTGVENEIDREKERMNELQIEWNSVTMRNSLIEMVNSPSCIAKDNCFLLTFVII